jgi:hypothetical protein
MEEMRNAYNILDGKYEEKSTIRSPKRRWEDNVKMVSEYNVEVFTMILMTVVNITTIKQVRLNPLICRQTA